MNGIAEDVTGRPPRYADELREARRELEAVRRRLVLCEADRDRFRADAQACRDQLRALQASILGPLPFGHAAADAELFTGG